MSDRSLPRAILLGLALIVAPSLVLIALEVYQAVATAPRLKENRELVVHTLEAIATAQGLFQEVQSAQRAVRAYLNTGRETDLGSYRASTARAAEGIATLKRETSNNEEQQRRLSVLEREIGAWFAELEGAVRIAATSGLEAARPLLQTDAPLEAMRAIGALTDAIVAAEQALLAQRLERAEREERRTALRAGAAAALAFGIMLTGVVLTLFAFRHTRRAETARQESDERFRMLVEGVTDYAIYLIDPKGRITNWNAGANRIKGYTADEIVGEHFSRFYTEEDRAAGLPRRALETAQREGKYEAEGWRVRKDGSRFMASVVIDPLRDRSGELIGFAKITRDISERVRQQQVLDQTKAALAQSQKLEALGQLTGGIAHDFNNLLHVIKNAIEILERRLQPADPESRKFFEMMRRNADRAASLTRRLLAFARRQPLEPRPIDPNRLVAGATDLLRQALGEGIAIETALGPDVWPVSADVNQLETALLNLAVNARDAMPRGGKVTIETANAFLDARYVAAHDDLAPGPYVMIAVTDTGEGMTPEVVAQAFDPFFTTKALGAGTGLGLSQVYGFIKQSAGHARIDSAPGEGTTVRLYLPRLADAELAKIEPASPPAPAATADETILVVEDDEDVRAFTVEVLKRLGYNVLVAGDGPEALRALADSPEVSLLFTDVGLPGGMNGRELADAARRSRPHLKVLFTTGYAANAFSRPGRPDPGVELIVKPFAQSDLAGRIRRMLDPAGYAGRTRPRARTSRVAE